MGIHNVEIRICKSGRVSILVCHCSPSNWRKWIQSLRLPHLIDKVTADKEISHIFPQITSPALKYKKIK